MIDGNDIASATGGMDHYGGALSGRVALTES